MPPEVVDGLPPTPATCLPEGETGSEEEVEKGEKARQCSTSMKLPQSGTVELFCFQHVSTCSVQGVRPKMRGIIHLFCLCINCLLTVANSCEVVESRRDMIVCWSSNAIYFDVVLGSYTFCVRVLSQRGHPPLPPQARQVVLARCPPCGRAARLLVSWQWPVEDSWRMLEKSSSGKKPFAV